jgi:hypothetical protein
MTSPPRLRLVHDRRDAPPDDDGTARVGAGEFEEHQVLEPEESGDEAAATAEDAEARSRRARAIRLAVAGGVAFQALAVLHDAPRDVAYATAGAVAPPAVLAFPACAVLYAATAWLGAGRARGGTRALFLVAAAAMAIAVPFWGLASPVTWPFELGGTLALAGAWLVHRERGLGLHAADDAGHGGILP